jgi:hypothetical protein
VVDTGDREVVDIADRQAGHTVDAMADADVAADAAEDEDRLHRRHNTTI